ncbi:acyltransferase [Novosphingobium resinovorum]|uniref:acyltransferase family protein n=1 Tax=Novosphingobium resinovorum TaxID=158500 RepID=UPI002ED382B1|nr:acyltransferase [Novosphingobium resinovorum]
MTRSAKTLPMLVPADPAGMRRNHFNAIRLAMAMAVIWSHSFAIHRGSEDTEPVSLLLGGFYNAGSVGVRVFFIVSGFLIARSWLASPQAAGYFAKRARRIYPGFIVATAICAFVVVPLHATAGWTLVSPAAVLDWSWRALTLHGGVPGADAFGGQAVNGALWSIRYEAWCYVGVAVAGGLGLMRRPGLLVAATLGVMVGKAMLDVMGKQPGGGLVEAVFGWPYAWFSLAPCFLMGMLAQCYGRFVPRSMAGLCVLLAGLVATTQLGGGSRIAFDLLFPLAATYAVLFAAFSPVRLPDAARFGDFSYGAYLYGFPIQQMLKWGLALSFPVYVLASFGFSLLAGAASWVLVEQWFVRRPVRAARAVAPPPELQPA